MDNSISFEMSQPADGDVVEKASNKFSYFDDVDSCSEGLLQHMDQKYGPIHCIKMYQRKSRSLKISSVLCKGCDRGKCVSSFVRNVDGVEKRVFYFCTDDEIVHLRSCPYMTMFGESNLAPSSAGNKRPLDNSAEKNSDKKRQALSLKMSIRSRTFDSVDSMMSGLDQYYNSLVTLDKAWELTDENIAELRELGISLRHDCCASDDELQHFNYIIRAMRLGADVTIMRNLRLDLAESIGIFRLRLEKLLRKAMRKDGEDLRPELSDNGGREESNGARPTRPSDKDGPNGSVGSGSQFLASSSGLHLDFQFRSEAQPMDKVGEVKSLHHSGNLLSTSIGEEADDAIVRVPGRDDAKLVHYRSAAVCVRALMRHLNEKHGDYHVLKQQLNIQNPPWTIISVVCKHCDRGIAVSPFTRKSDVTGKEETLFYYHKDNAIKHGKDCIMFDGKVSNGQQTDTALLEDRCTANVKLPTPTGVISLQQMMSYSYMVYSSLTDSNFDSKDDKTMEGTLRTLNQSMKYYSLLSEEEHKRFNIAIDSMKMETGGRDLIFRVRSNLAVLVQLYQRRLQAVICSFEGAPEIPLRSNYTPYYGPKVQLPNKDSYIATQAQHRELPILTRRDVSIEQNINDFQRNVGTKQDYSMSEVFPGKGSSRFAYFNNQSACVAAFLEHINKKFGDIHCLKHYEKKNPSRRSISVICKNCERGKIVSSYIRKSPIDGREEMLYFYDKDSVIEHKKDCSLWNDLVAKREHCSVNDGRHSNTLMMHSSVPGIRGDLSYNLSQAKSSDVGNYRLHENRDTVKKISNQYPTDSWNYQTDSDLPHADAALLMNFMRSSHEHGSINEDLQ